MLLLISIMSVNSASLYSSINNNDYIQDLDLSLFKTTSKTLELVFTNLTNPISPSATNWGQDTRLLYFISNNNNINVPFVFQVNYKDNDDNLQAVYQEINLSPSGTTTFWVEPSRDLEYMAVYGRCLGEIVENTTPSFNGSTCGAGYQMRYELLTKSDKGVNSVFTPLINGVVDLIQINLSIWKVTYYVFIFSLVIGLIIGIILLLIKLYKIAENHQLINKKRSNHK